MTILRHIVCALLCAGFITPVSGSPDHVYLKKMPKGGDVPFGKIVYVDDGKCPRGEVKEVTGGSDAKAVPREVRCVKRPVKAP